MSFGEGGVPLLKRARREIRRHSRWGDCPCALRFLKSRSWKSVSQARAASRVSLAPEPRRLAESTLQPPVPGIAPRPPVLCCDCGRLSSERLFTFSSPSSPPPCLSSSPSLSLEASAVALDPAPPASERAEKSLALKKKKKKISDSSSLLPALSKLELQTGFRPPSSSFLCSEPPEGVLGCNPSPAALLSRACLPCPKT